MKTTLVERLDKATPKWPEVRITLRDRVDGETDDSGDENGDLDDADTDGGQQVQPAAATVTVSGVITDVADEAEALTRTAAQARTLGRPIRARITHAGSVRRVIVDTDGTVTHLDGPPQAAPRAAATNSTGGPVAAAGSTPITKNSSPRRLIRGWRTGAGPARSKVGGILAAFPAPLRPVLKWGAPVVGVLFLASVVVLIVKGSSTGDEPAGPAPTAQVPPPGRLYTELAPPGWSQQAAWTVQLAKDAPAPVTTDDGTIVAVTATDRSAVPVDDGDRYLSVLETDGRTRWAVPLDTAPRLGPAVITVDGTQVAMIAGTREITYWPLTGGPETDVPLPAGAKVTPTGLVELRDDQLGYLHNGALTVVDALPRTKPAIAIDGAAIVSQTDNGTWWTLRADQEPVPTVPAPPAGTTGVERILVVAADHVFIAWATAQPDDCVVGVYDTDTGAQQATAAARCGALPRAGAAYASTATIAGIGPLALHGSDFTITDGVTVTAAVDQTYGTVRGDAVTIAANGTTAPLAAGTLIPLGQSGDHLLVVDSDQELYAIEPRKS